MPLTALEESYWRAYLATLRPSEAAHPPRVTAGRAGRPQDADDLLARYLDGTKTAGSSLLADFLAAHDPVPEVGSCWIVLSSDGEPRCLLRTVRIETHRFADVPAEIAVAEGEGDLSLAWRPGASTTSTRRRSSPSSSTSCSADPAGRVVALILRSSRVSGLN